MKFYRCNVCGNIVAVLEDRGVAPTCCGTAMEELIPGTTDGIKEKHVPVINRKGNTVKVAVGSYPHPMTDEHHIDWIILETDKGFNMRSIDNEDMAYAQFCINDDERIISAYEYCNLHGLWSVVYRGL